MLNEHGLVQVNETCFGSTNEERLLFHFILVLMIDNNLTNPLSPKEKLAPEARSDYTLTSFFSCVDMLVVGLNFPPNACFGSKVAPYKIAIPVASTANADNQGFQDRSP